MDYQTFEFLRSYCWQDLSPYLDKPNIREAINLSSRLGGHAEVLKHEQELAMSLYQCRDLTPKEKTAAHLLAVISNAHAITFQRDANLVSNPAPPLEKWQAEALSKQIREAVADYVLFVSALERENLLAKAEQAVNAMIQQFSITTPAALTKSESGEKCSPPPKETPNERHIRLLKRRDELKTHGVKAFLATLATEEGVSISRIKQYLKVKSEKESAKTKATPYSQLTDKTPKGRY